MRRRPITSEPLRRRPYGERPTSTSHEPRRDRMGVAVRYTPLRPRRPSTQTH